MIIIRPVVKEDFKRYVTLAFQSHINFYTLPKCERLLEKQFNNSLNSFTSDVHAPQDQYYIFVAEDTDTKQLLGVSALAATTGGQEPLFFFRRETVEVKSSFPQVVKQLTILNPVSYAHGPSEVCSLFVDRAARGTGVGKLLSLARFLFMAKYPERFTGSVVSELRGKLVDGTSIFWDAVGSHFFRATLIEVQEKMNYGRSFIADFLPQHPIYEALLPLSVQKIIGQVDKDTEAAYSMLLRLGFEVTNEVDVIDGGPKIVAQKTAIRPVSHSRVLTVGIIEELEPLARSYMIANERLDFRACVQPLVLLSDTSAAISPQTAEALQLGIGDAVRIFDPKSI